MVPMHLLIAVLLLMVLMLLQVLVQVLCKVHMQILQFEMFPMLLLLSLLNQKLPHWLSSQWKNAAHRMQLEIIAAGQVCGKFLLMLLSQ
jgi:hypothetical protein